LSIDYEIFGNGRGNVIDHIIEPTDKILSICDKYKVPLTIMFEVNEYLKYKEHEVELEKDLGYSPSKLIEIQLSEALKKGHDIQLHIHPQWLDAEYIDKEWLIPNPKRVITSLSNNEIENILNRGKQELEKIFQPIDPNYACLAMRLTNMPWCEAPSEVIPAMKKNGIFAHSLSISNSPKNNEKGFWPLDANNTIFEFPIHSLEAPKYKIFTFKRIMTSLYRKKYVRDESLGTTYNKNKYENKLTRFMNLFTEKYDLKWDFCKQSSKKMIKFLEIGMSRYNYRDHEVPLVMIGHSKDFFNEKEFGKFLEKCKSRYISQDSKIQFSSFQKFIENTIKY